MSITKTFVSSESGKHKKMRHTFRTFTILWHVDSLIPGTGGLFAPLTWAHDDGAAMYPCKVRVHPVSAVHYEVVLRSV